MLIKIKDVLSKVLSLNSTMVLVVGVAVGYLGHPVIKLAIDGVLGMVHLLAKL